MLENRLRVGGLGITAGAHLSLETIFEIKRSDLVFVLHNNPIQIEIIKRYNVNVRDLSLHYSVDLDRSLSYEKMVDEVIYELRKGQNICALFYGHPAVFAYPSRKMIHIAKKDGFDSQMLAAISGDACLFSDLNVDPGDFGCQQYEATRLLHYKATIDTSAGLVIWQMPAVGIKEAFTGIVNKRSFDALKEKLSRIYSASHISTVYLCKELVVGESYYEEFKISEIPYDIPSYSTVWIPPFRSKEVDINYLP